MIFFTPIVFGMGVLTDLYSKYKIDKITDSLVLHYIWPTYKVQTKDGTDCKSQLLESEESHSVKAIDLHRFLYSNIHAMDPTGKWRAGDETPAEYQKMFTSLIAKNPTILYNAIETYGEYAIRQINSKLGYKKKEELIEDSWYMIDDWNYFTTHKFWLSQRDLIRRYHMLIDALLKLNDQDLEYFINSNKIDDDAASYDCQNWLEENKLSSRHSNYEIQNLLEIHKVQVDPLETYTIRWANHDSNNFNYYPGDLLCLTQRTAKYYPEWNHRRFLIEAKKTSNLFLEIIERNYLYK